MIKVIAFDFVGVLVSEKDVNLSETEDRLERLFGPNISDEDYLNMGCKYEKNKKKLINITKGIINKLYKINDLYLLKNIKKIDKNIKIVIATNHVSYIRQYIKDNFDNKYLDDIIISSEIHEIKPNKEFYRYILNKYDLNPEELLFLDDNESNILGAKTMGINTIKVDENTDVLKEIKNGLLWDIKRYILWKKK